MGTGGDGPGPTSLWMEMRILMMWKAGPCRYSVLGVLLPHHHCTDRTGECKQPLQKDQARSREAVRSQTFVVKTQGRWKADMSHLQRCFISENK